MWRAWTTDSCISSIEIPQEASLINEKAIRTVYNDQRGCNQHFKFLTQSNITKLEEEIHVGLKHLFENNGITTPVNIEKATRTVVKDWPGAWYWLGAGSPYSNKYISRWALKPLEGEDISLVGDGYNPQRAGWADGAIKSAINLLKAQYNVGGRTYRSFYSNKLAISAHKRNPHAKPAHLF